MRYLAEDRTEATVGRNTCIEHLKSTLARTH
jgi:hypothetical protein